uniref:Protein kinase domain-containing protein n=1 Tax=Nelumbo nucifera TaxID=4432 RepID=A0A822YD80_NELNU|nr:TPA_asm: hypothetical protein HUJ06_030717 [Nelumbo nucifera]
MQSIVLIFLFLVEVAFGKSESDALLEFKKGIEKDPQNILSSWRGNSLSSDGCLQNWYGISCTGGHVTSITLDDLGLEGNFQFSALANLEMLRNLSISNNQLMGTVMEIGSIKSLAWLDLSHNAFHGSIPSDVMNLQNLVLLNLSSNNFSGTIPSGFRKLENLKFLDLHSNGFTGDVSSLLMQLQNVVYVDLSSNMFSGSLDLGPGNSTFVSTVQYLNLSYNSLVGELFAHDGMPYFDNLEVFDASYNQLTGQIPSFSFVVSLQILRLRSNQLSGSLPVHLLQESSTLLTELDLSLNQLEGPLGTVTSATLKYLNLSSNKLSGSLPAKVGNCAIVDLSNNMLSGQLSRIQSWGNYVEVIHLSSNLLTGTFPNRTSQFLRLNSFKVSNNSIEGVLPLVLGTYPQLNVIDFSHNKLNGPLLPSLFTSLKLTALNLSGNSLSGPIPLQALHNVPSLGSNQNMTLVFLDLSDNSLSGNLPSEFSDFHDLVYLDISMNHFEGSIPENLPDGLKEFNVSYNNLSGVVPVNLRRFPDSAFHPGNSLLILPHPSPKDAPEVTLRGKHGIHTKSVVKTALIAGFVGMAAILALLSLIVYHKACRQRCEGWRNNSNETVEKKGIPEGGSPGHHVFGIHKSVDPSRASLGLSQDRLASSEMDSVHEHGGTSSIIGKSTELQIPGSLVKDKAISSPISIFSSSSPCSNDLHLSENPIVLRVYSPDKLAGDLHLFEGSPGFTLEELSRAPAEVIGRSCHGISYKATLDRGSVLAVKWLKEGISKGKKEFSREAKKLGNIRHPNIVSLQGYYWGPKDHEKLLISNYINASCLADYLFGKILLFLSFVHVFFFDNSVFCSCYAAQNVCDS